MAWTERAKYRTNLSRLTISLRTQLQNVLARALPLSVVSALRVKGHYHPHPSVLQSNMRTGGIPSLYFMFLLKFIVKQSTNRQRQGL